MGFTSVVSLKVSSSFYKSYFTLFSVLPACTYICELLTCAREHTFAIKGCGRMVGCALPTPQDRTGIPDIQQSSLAVLGSV